MQEEIRIGRQKKGSMAFPRMHGYPGPHRLYNWFPCTIHAKEKFVTLIRDLPEQRRLAPSMAS